jgi:hypothetical protein
MLVTTLHASTPLNHRESSAQLSGKFNPHTGADSLQCCTVSAFLDLLGLTIFVLPGRPCNHPETDLQSHPNLIEAQVERGGIFGMHLSVIISHLSLLCPLSSRLKTPELLGVALALTAPLAVLRSKPPWMRISPRFGLSLSFDNAHDACVQFTCFRVQPKCAQNEPNTCIQHVKLPVIS